MSWGSSESNPLGCELKVRLLPRSPSPLFYRIGITQTVHVKFKVDYHVLVLLSTTTADLSHSLAELLGITNPFLT